MTKLRIINVYIIATIIFYYVADIAQAFTLPANSRSQALLKVDETLLEDRILEAREVVNKHARAKRQLNIIQSKIVDIVHPKPIVDTIREEEKYGNTVDHKFGRTIVRAVESLSNVINAVFAFPVDTVKKASRTATEALNNIGGKLVGLQK